MVEVVVMVVVVVDVARGARVKTGNRGGAGVGGAAVIVVVVGFVVVVAVVIVVVVVLVPPAPLVVDVVEFCAFAKEKIEKETSTKMKRRICFIFCLMCEKIKTKEKNHWQVSFLFFFFKKMKN
jgi:hypothetical protein